MPLYQGHVKLFPFSFTYLAFHGAIFVSSKTSVIPSIHYTQVAFRITTTFRKGSFVIEVFTIPLMGDASSISLSACHCPQTSLLPLLRLRVVQPILLLVIALPVGHIWHRLCPLVPHLLRQLFFLRLPNS